MFRTIICTMVLASLSMLVFDAAAYTMPADKLLAMSNKQLAEKGQAHWDKNELDSALICFNIVANRADRKQSLEETGFVSGALTAMANIYSTRFFDYERAMQCLLKSEKFARDHHFDLQLVDIYELMATIENEKNNIQHDFTFNTESFELHRKAFNLAAKHRNPQHVMVTSIINLITAALGHQKLESIKNELDSFQATELYDSIPGLQFAKHQCRAASYALRKQYDLALNELAQLDHCLDMVEHAIPSYRFVTHENRFFIYRDMGDAIMALSELDSMEQIATEHNIKVGLLEAFSYKRDYYAEKGNTTLAKEFDLRYLHTKDQLLEESKAAKADEEKVLFRLNEANHEIKELSYKQRIQKTELIAVAVVALLLLALLVIGWIGYRSTSEKSRALYLQNQQLLANAERMRQMRQEEQERQAQEIQTTSSPSVKYGRGKMENDDISQVMAKVEHVMESSPEVFSTNFTLNQLVALTGETESRVSQAINTSGRTYYGMLNEYRVREACRRMNDKELYSGLTIEAIGQSVGFKSRSNFVATFKRLTGLTPSAYLKQPSKIKEQPNAQSKT